MRSPPVNATAFKTALLSSLHSPRLARRATIDTILLARATTGVNPQFACIIGAPRESHAPYPVDSQSASAFPFGVLRLACHVCWAGRPACYRDLRSPRAVCHG